MIDIVQAVKDAGFPYWDDLVHLFVGGSELHGAKVQGTDDCDLYGVYIEPPEKILGLDKFEHFVWSTSGNERRNGPQDIDITLYSLRKWAGLACKGNPTALHFLFAPNQSLNSDFWYGIKEDIKKCVLAKSAVKQFVGFVDAQMGRLLGTRGQGKHGQRPELEEKYGYDVKAGMHAVRLLYECIELLKDKQITLPRPERQMLINIRTGMWSLDHLCQEVSKLRDSVSQAEYWSELGDAPNREKLNTVLSDAYQRYWREKAKRDKARSEHEELRAASRKIHAQREAAIKKVQKDCPHMAGSLLPFSSNSIGKTCIVWHIFEDDPEHAVGICMHCGKQWRYTDYDYDEWRKKPCMNTLSTGGLRVTPSSAAPHMPGIPIPDARNDALDYLRQQREPEYEPPLKMTLKEFLFSELLKRVPEKAAQRLLSGATVKDFIKESLHKGLA